MNQINHSGNTLTHISPRVRGPILTHAHAHAEDERDFQSEKWLIK